MRKFSTNLPIVASVAGGLLLGCLPLNTYAQLLPTEITTTLASRRPGLQDSLKDHSRYTRTLRSKQWLAAEQICMIAAETRNGVFAIGDSFPDQSGAPSLLVQEPTFIADYQIVPPGINHDAVSTGKNTPQPLKQKPAFPFQVHQLLVLNPTYERFRQLGEGVMQRQYFWAELEETRFLSLLKTAASQNGISIALLDPLEMQPTQSALFAEMLVLQTWVKQRLSDTLAPSGPLHEQVCAIANRLGTSHILWAGVQAYHGEQEHPLLLSPSLKSGYNAIVFEVQTGKWTEIKRVWTRGADHQAFLQQHLYDTFGQLRGKHCNGYLGNRIMVKAECNAGIIPTEGKYAPTGSLGIHYILGRHSTLGVNYGWKQQHHTFSFYQYSEDSLDWYYTSYTITDQLPYLTQRYQTRFFHHQIDGEFRWFLQAKHGSIAPMGLYAGIRAGLDIGSIREQVAILYLPKPTLSLFNATFRKPLTTGYVTTCIGKQFLFKNRFMADAGLSSSRVFIPGGKLLSGTKFPQHEAPAINGEPALAYNRYVALWTTSRDLYQRAMLQVYCSIGIAF